jgi:hypothetical protein
MPTLTKTIGEPVYISATFKNTGNIPVKNFNVGFALYGPSSIGGYAYALGPLDVGASASISNQKAVETTGLPEGSYVLRMYFSEGQGTTPFSQYDALDWTINVVSQPPGLLRISAYGPYNVILHPEIYVDGVYAGTAPVSVNVSPGTHTVTFGALAGFDTPSPQSVTVSSGQTLDVSAIYVVSSITNITLKVYVLTSTGAGVSGIQVTVTPIVNGTPDTSKAVTQYTSASGLASFSIPANSGQYQVKANTYPASTPKTITVGTSDITLTFTSEVY